MKNDNDVFKKIAGVLSQHDDELDYIRSAIRYIVIFVTISYCMSLLSFIYLAVR